MKNTNKLYNTKTKLEYFLNNENLNKITKNSISTKKKPIIKPDEKKEIISLSTDRDEDGNDNTMKTLVEINNINTGKLKTALKIINDMYSVSKNDGEMFLFKKLNLIVEDSIKASECLLNQANNFYQQLVEININQGPTKLVSLENELAKTKEKYMSVVVLNTEYQRKIDLLEQETKLNKNLNKLNKNNVVTPSEIESIHKINKHLKSKFESKLVKYESDALSTQEKLNVLHLVISDLISKSEKDADLIKNLSKESNQKFDISKDKIILHKSYFINEENHFALVSDNEKKVYQWIDVNNPNNNKVKTHINEVTDILKDLIKYKKRSQELDIQCENLKKTYIDEIELREKENENYLIMKKYVENVKEINFYIQGIRKSDSFNKKLNDAGRFDTFSKNDLINENAIYSNEQLKENDLKHEFTDIYETGNCSVAEEKRQNNIISDLGLKDSNYHGLINKAEYKYKTRSKGSINNENLDVFINKNERGEKGDRSDKENANNNYIEKVYKENRNQEQSNLIKCDRPKISKNNNYRSDNNIDTFSNISSITKENITKPNINFKIDENDNNNEKIQELNDDINMKIIEKDIIVIKKINNLLHLDKTSTSSLKDINKELIDSNTSNKNDYNNITNNESNFNKELQVLIQNLIEKISKYDNAIVKSEAKINALEFEKDSLKKIISENKNCNNISKNESKNEYKSKENFDENNQIKTIKILKNLSKESELECCKFNEYLKEIVQNTPELKNSFGKSNLKFNSNDSNLNKNKMKTSDESNDNNMENLDVIVLNLQSSINEKQNVILDLIKFTDILKSEYENIKQEKSIISQKIEKLTLDNTVLKHDYNNKNNQYLSAIKSLEDLKIKSDNLSFELSTQKEEMKKMESNLLIEANSNSNINNQMKLKTEEDQLNLSISYNKEIKEHKEQIEMLKGKLRELSSEFDETKKLLRNEENLNLIANNKLKEYEKTGFNKSELLQKLHEKIQTQDEELIKLRHQTDSDYITIQNSLLAINKFKENEENYLKQINKFEEIKQNLILDKQKLLDELREIEKSNFMLSASLSNANKLVEKKSGLIEKMITDPNIIDELALSTGKKFDNSAILSRPYMSNLISAYDKEFNSMNNAENDDDLIENFNTFYSKTNNNVLTRIKTNEKIDLKENDRVDIDQYNSEKLCNEDFNIETNDNLFDRNNYVLRDNMNEVVMNTNFTYKSNISNMDLKFKIQNDVNFEIIPNLNNLINYGFKLDEVNSYNFLKESLDFSKILKKKILEVIDKNNILKTSNEEIIDNFNLKEVALTNKINELYTEISEKKNLIDKLKSKLSYSDKKDYDLKNQSLIEDIENIIQNSNDENIKNNDDEYIFSGKNSDIDFVQANNEEDEENINATKKKYYLKSNLQSENFNFNEGKNNYTNDLNNDNFKEKDNHGSISSHSFILNNQLKQKIIELKNEIEYLNQENNRIDLLNTNFISLNESLEASLKQVSENYENLLKKETDVRKHFNFSI